MGVFLETSRFWFLQVKRIVGSHSSPNKLCRNIKDIPHAFAKVNLQPVSAVMLQAFVAVKEQAKEMTLEVLSNTVIEQVGQVAQEVDKCHYEYYYRHGRTFIAHVLKLECTCLVLHRRVDFLHHFCLIQMYHFCLPTLNRVAGACTDHSKHQNETGRASS